MLDCPENRANCLTCEVKCNSGPTEIVQLRVCTIALENLVTHLLLQAPHLQLLLAREMAVYILPRAGRTPQDSTLRAADEMRSLLQRATRFCVLPSVK